MAPFRGTIENLSATAVVARFDQDHANSDAGAILLKAWDEKLKLSTTLASCLSDDPQQSKVTHSLETLFQQRLFAIACSYADGNDAARLADDPVMKLMAGRDPVAGGSLASQPTQSRCRPRSCAEFSVPVSFSVAASLPAVTSFSATSIQSALLPPALKKRAVGNPGAKLSVLPLP